MDSVTAARLIELNRDFYSRFGGAFSATRGRLQPGVLRILRSLRGDESVLDLGCGNGELARELARRGHRGPYLGLDFSLPLLHDARSGLKDLNARFLQADLTHPLDTTGFLAGAERWSLITCFAVLHHIPGEAARLDVLRAVRKLLAAEGHF